MRVFLHLLVVGVSGAITLTNMGRGMTTPIPVELQDSQSSQNPSQIETIGQSGEHEIAADPVEGQKSPLPLTPSSAITEPSVSTPEAQFEINALSHAELDNVHRLSENVFLETLPEEPQDVSVSESVGFLEHDQALETFGAGIEFVQESPPAPSLVIETSLETSPLLAQNQDPENTNVPEDTNESEDTNDSEDTNVTPPIETQENNPGFNLPPAITDSYPAPTPNGTLQTNPPAIIEPSPNPLLFPTQPSEVRIEETIPVTLEQAVDLARRNNQEIQVAELQLEQGKAAVREQQAALWPQLSFQSTIQRSDNAVSELQRNAQNRLVRRRKNDGVQGLSEDFTSLGINQFTNTLQMTYDLGLDGGRAAQIRAAEESLRLRELEYERIAEQLRLDVSNDYYTLQAADSSVLIAQAAVENAQKSLKDAEALERAGVGTRFSVLQSQVQLANEQQLLAQSISEQRTARRRLAERLNINQSVSLTAADPVQEAGIWNPSLEESIVLAFKNRAELEQLLVERDRNEALRDVALAQIRPQVSLFANYNVLAQFPDDGDPFQTRGWGDGYTVGAQLQWNFFDGGAAKARARQREIDSQIAETRFSQTLNQIRREVEQAYFQLESSFENISTAKLGLEQAEEALRLARLRFQAGVGTQTDVINQETELTRARGNLVRAIIGYNRALSSLHRSVSNLPDGNLSDVP